MNKFIKVTVVGDDEYEHKHSININYVESFKDGHILTSSGFELDILESTEEIENQMKACLRDGFAMNAMNGLLSNSSLDDIGADDIAHDAYLFADAMLKERSK